MDSYLKNRKAIVDFIQAELEGPCPKGKPLCFSDNLVFETWESAYGKPFIQDQTGEEILKEDPLRRYGIGVLYPTKELAEKVLEKTLPPEIPEYVAETESSEFNDAINEIIAATPSSSELDVTDDEIAGQDILRFSNEMFQSCMGVSFVVQANPQTNLIVKFTGGVYIKKPVRIAEKEPINWWVRKPIFRTAEFELKDFPQDRRETVKPASILRNEEQDNLDITIEAISRPHGIDQRLVTVFIVNRTEDGSDLNGRCIFQSRFTIRPSTLSTESPILPYPDRKSISKNDEDATLSLLYQTRPAFAIGHGCAADWTSSENGRATCISVESIPKYEIPAITAQVTDSIGKDLGADMGRLAGLKDGNETFLEIAHIIDEYEKWVDERRSQVENLSQKHRDAANRHLINCDLWIKRLKDGLKYLQTDSKSAIAFKLANHAMLLQQIQSNVNLRKTVFDPLQLRFTVEGEFPKPDPLVPPPGRGMWRAFQIAFLVANVRSLSSANDDDRETVDLVWFPTGGGKTEAYLAAISYATFYRRLTDPGDVGVHTIMRYTLRLLTTQQFQRAATLICAMEYIRKQKLYELGDQPFRIGLWLGDPTTPNTRKDALTAFNKLRAERSQENPFLLLKCPWCSAKFGHPVLINRENVKGKKVKYGRTTHAPMAGYTSDGGTIIFQCPDSRCDFNKGIPAIVIDEDLYALRPDLIIATVDKLAVLPWKSEARSLFGIDDAGRRVSSPPGLIIQDELHLITGALGTLTGLYESLVEELCIDRRKSQAIKPKIICSTATIRNYDEQIRGLFARTKVMLFPSPGLDIGDSFFARYERDHGGKLIPGKIYVGIHAPGLRSMQTAQVRTLTALVEAPMELPESERDPWWTLVSFFNSLRELGTTLTLFQADIRDRKINLKNRLGKEPSELRPLKNAVELTSRLKSHEVPGIIAKLESPYLEEAVDVCLASSMIEVGIDIDRLSIMLVNGQPKSTSQYIQVTGRVGRKKPGLVITLYNYSRPRDRSYYERFRSYHETFYAQVEPSSVTPFSSPSLHRFLHSVMLGYVRQTMRTSKISTPDPCPTETLEILKKILDERAKVAANTEEQLALAEEFRIRVSEWRKWKPQIWEAARSENIPLMHTAGGYIPEEWRGRTWPVPRSLRNIDASCEIELSSLYQKEDE